MTRPTAAVLSTLGALALSGCTYLHFPTNALLHPGTPAAPYRFDQVVPPATAARDDETFVVLTLSGGGTRAAAFAYGVMRELDRAMVGGGDRSLLDEVDVISSVSGGSFAAAYYGLFGKGEFFADFKPKVLSRRIQTDLALAVLAPWNWPRLLSPYFSRSDLAAEYYDEHLLAGRHFDRMPRRRPFVVLNATDMTLGAQFSFTQDDFDTLCSDLDSVPVGRALTASSAFPGAFAPVAVRNYPKRDCGYQSPGWFRGAAQDRDRLPSRYDRYVTAKDYERDDRAYLHLLDGGLSDNIGLRGATTALSSTDSSWQLRRKIEAGHVKRIVVIIVDAKPKGEPVLDRSARAPGLTSVIVAAGTNPMENYSTDTIDLLESRFYEERRAAQSFADTRLGCRTLAAAHCARRSERRACERRLQRECDEALGTSTANDLPTPELYRVYVRFASADDPIRARLESITTALQLTPPEVDLLIEQGGALLHKTADYERLLKDLGVAARPPQPARAAAGGGGS